MPQQVIPVIMAGALILWAIYRRIRRTIGWQLFLQRKLWVRTIIFAVIGSIFLSGGLLHPISFISDLVGIAIGMTLAFYSASTTSFEQRGASWYFRPNTWVGSLVTLIFLARLAYRFYVVYQLQDELANIQATNGNGYQNLSSTIGSSWTSGLLLIMFAYYIYYYILVIKKQKSLQFSEKTTL